jgi:pimeloyl-ACP methyl ester carboxylesterase
MTAIDDLDIHFIHVRSRHPNAMPIIITHGWPGSVIEQLKIIGPLTDPTAHGGRAEDAFDVVIPSLPGYGFSEKPTGTGWDLDRIARAWAELMKRLGYTRYVTQGGDWGAPVSSAMARRAAAGLLGIHINLPATVPPEVAAALGSGPVPAGLFEKERAVLEALMKNAKNGNSAYFTMMTARPQTVGYGAADSPAGLAAWILVHPGFAQWAYGNDVEKSPTKDDVLDNITLYWLTNTAASAARLYWENGARGSVIVAAAQKTGEISLPVAITVFPDHVATEHWCSNGFANTDLDLQLKKHGIHQLIVIGLIAHTCVEATVRFAAELGYEVTVVRDATADYSEKEMHPALDVNLPNYASSIVSTDEIVASISSLDDFGTRVEYSDSRASAANIDRNPEGVHR